MKNKFTNLHYELQNRNISIEEFALKVFTSARTVDNWCHGKNKPSRGTKALVSKALKLSTTETLELFNFAK